MDEPFGALDAQLKMVMQAELRHRRHSRCGGRQAALRLEPADYTHAHAVLSRLDNLVAINSALEVDLTGQVSSEVAGRRYRGTIGGLADFARGALAAEGGRSIIVLASRTGRDGSRRTIVPVCTSGFVSPGRADADITVTEYGRACLRGLPLDQRIGRMISIAHPDDREAMERDAAAIAGR
jgi:acyl-CoA hydrolase